MLPYVKDTDTIILANHGTITYGSDLEDAYFKTEIIDAYCRILILAKQLGTVNYYSDEKAAELIKIKPNLGIPDPRLARGLENCDLCGNSLFREGYSDFKPEPKAFIPAKFQKPARRPSRKPRCSAPTGGHTDSLGQRRSRDQVDEGDEPSRSMNGLSTSAVNDGVIRDLERISGGDGLP